MLPVPFAALAICIFLWGLQYKLSLYHSTQTAGHSIPSAKLLSKDEQPAIPADAFATQLEPVKITAGAFNVSTILLIAFAVLYLASSIPLAAREERLPGLVDGMGTTLFVRPPPRFA